MDNLFTIDSDSTSLSAEEKEGLIPSWITLRSELNDAEQRGILEAEKWAFSRKKNNILSEDFIKRLHQKMFGSVWSWAGKFRTTGKNIGVDAWRIGVELKILLDDTKFWIEHHTYSPDEIGARFHHKLVWIHPFPNGNGRHARLMTDILMNSLGQSRFSWGATNLDEENTMRKEYITALHEADQGNFLPLIKFVRK